MKDDKDPRRMEYLRQFADKEGRAYLLRFWRKYKDKKTDERISTLLEGLKPSADCLAAVHRYLLPEASVSEFVRFMDDKLPPITRDKLTNKQLEKLYNKYGRGKYSQPDQGFIARVHPLELWLLGYLNEHHLASLPMLLRPAVINAKKCTFGCLKLVTVMPVTAECAPC
ncbi:hypothetical protein HND97_09235 [Vibrio cholerae]|nr:hypothetical protein HND97_09235 [Vibrio cholerae]